MGLLSFCFGVKDSRQYIYPGSSEVLCDRPQLRNYKTKFDTHYIEITEPVGNSDSRVYTVASKEKISLYPNAPTLPIKQVEKPRLGHEGMFIVPDNYHVKLTHDNNGWHAELEIDFSCLGCC